MHNGCAKNKVITMWRRCLLAFVLCFMALPGAWPGEVLRLGASSSWNMPYARYDGERLTGGIVYDLAMALEKVLSAPVQMVVLPRKRLDGATLAGDLDLRCYFNPNWTEIPDHFVWSGRIFDISDVLFGTDATQEPKDLGELSAGAQVSTVLGYSYPTLQPLITGGVLVRDDSVDQEKVMLKLSARRTPYGVSEALGLAWYKRNTPAHRLSKWTLIISRHDFQCGVPKNGNIAAARIINALTELKKNGRIDEILRSYR